MPGEDAEDESLPREHRCQRPGPASEYAPVREVRQRHGGRERRPASPSSLNNDDQFNFAFDIVDALAGQISRQAGHAPSGQATRRSGASPLSDMKRASTQAANYFKSLGIKQGRPGDAGAQAPLPVLVRHPGPAQAGGHRHPRHQPAAWPTTSTTASRPPASAPSSAPATGTLAASGGPGGGRAARH